MAHDLRCGVMAPQPGGKGQSHGPGEGGKDACKPVLKVHGVLKFMAAVVPGPAREFKIFF